MGAILPKYNILRGILSKTRQDFVNSFRSYGDFNIGTRSGLAIYDRKPRKCLCGTDVNCKIAEYSLGQAVQHPEFGKLIYYTFEALLVMVCPPKLLALPSRIILYSG